jgi:hypothetical protein
MLLLTDFVIICYTLFHIAFVLDETDISDIRHFKNRFPSLFANYIGTLDLECLNGFYFSFPSVIMVCFIQVSSSVTLQC